MPCPNMLCSAFSPPQSQFERHNAVELQPITERRTGPLHGRSSVPYICLRRGILRFTIDHLRASRVVATCLLARRLPSDIRRSAGDAVVRQVRSRGRQGAAKRQSVSSARLGKRTARASNGLALGLISGFGTFETSRRTLRMSVYQGRPEVSGARSK